MEHPDVAGGVAAFREALTGLGAPGAAVMGAAILAVALLLGAGLIRHRRRPG